MVGQLKLSLHKRMKWKRHERDSKISKKIISLLNHPKKYINYIQSKREEIF